MAIAKVYIDFPKFTAEQVRERFMDSMEEDYLVIPDAFLHRKDDRYSLFVFRLDEVLDDEEISDL